MKPVAKFPSWWLRDADPLALDGGLAPGESAPLPLMRLMLGPDAVSTIPGIRDLPATLSLPSLAGMEWPAASLPSLAVAPAAVSRSPFAPLKARFIGETATGSAAALAPAPQALDGGVVAQGPGGMVTQAEVNALKVGISEFLPRIDAALGLQVFGEELPLLTDALGDAFNAGAAPVKHIAAVREAIVTGLNSLQGSASYTSQQVDDAVTASLAGLGFSNLSVLVGFSNGGQFGGGDAVDLTLIAAKTHTFTSALDADFGLPGVGFTSSGTANSQLGYNYQFQFGTDDDGPFLKTFADNELEITLGTTIPDLNAQAHLGPLRFVATDLASSPTALNGTFAIDLVKAGFGGVGPGKLRLSDLTANPDIIDATFSGAANVHLNLAGDFGAIGAEGTLPNLSTDFHFDWAFDTAPIVIGDNNETFGSVPTLAFKNVSLGLGSFFTEFTEPILRNVRQVLGPWQPIIDAVQHPLALLTELSALNPAIPNTILEIAVANGRLTQQQADDFDLLAKILDIANGVPTTGAENVRIDLGDFAVLSGPGADPRHPFFRLANTLVGEVRSAIDAIQQHPLVAAFIDSIDEFPTDIPGTTEEGRGLQFPILDDPEIAIGLLLGKDVDLFTMDIATQNISLFELDEFIRITGPLGVRLEGEGDLRLDLDFGFDTRGVFQSFASGDLTGLFNGFYMKVPRDENGLPIPMAELNADFNASLALNFIAVEAGVGGGLDANVKVSFADPDADFRVHFDEFQELFEISPYQVFDASGKLTAGLNAYVTFGIELPSPLPDLSNTFSYDIATVTVVDYSFAGSDLPVLANVAGGNATLHLGPQAGLRVHGSITDVSEHFEISHEAGSAGSETIGINYTAGNSSNGSAFFKYPGVSNEIRGTGGVQDDRITLQPGVLSRAVLSGGVGNDYLTGGAGDDTLNGDAGLDLLIGGAGNDALNGGPDRDALEGGPGADVLDGGTENDAVRFHGASAAVTVNLTTNIHSGDALNDTFISIERFEGSIAHGDTFIGAGGNDDFWGLGGDDRLEGRGGDDVLEGGLGADYLDGGDGFDVLSYFRSTAAVNVNLATLTASGGDAQGDTIISVELVLGSPFHDTLTGSGGPNYLDGAEGNDTVSAAGGDDFVGFGPGADTLDGGSGTDVLTAVNADRGVLIDLTTGRGTYGHQLAAPGSPQLPVSMVAGFETLVGGNFNDRLVIGAGVSRIEGNAGDDVLDVGTLRGTTQDPDRNDVILAGAGLDMISTDFSDLATAISITSGPTQSLDIATDRKAMDFEFVRDIATGSGNDVLDFRVTAPQDLLVRGDFRGHFIRTGAGNDTIRTGGGLIVTPFHDDIDAGEGDDFVDAGENGDIVNAGPGNDYVVAASTEGTPVFDSFGTPIGGVIGDTLIGGDGVDTVDFSGVFLISGGRQLGVSVNLATGQCSVGAIGFSATGFENLIGTPYGDTLNGSAGNNRFWPLRGGGYSSAFTSGPDGINGGAGEDTLIIDFSTLGSFGAVTTTFSSIQRRSADGLTVVDGYLWSGIEDFEITGTEANDLLTAGDANATGFNGTGISDIFYGLGGNDYLGGTGGGDRLYGGDGNDTISGQGAHPSNTGYNGTVGGLDVFDGGAGDDLVENVAFGNFSLPTPLAADSLMQLDGGSGFDTFSADFSNQTVPIVWNDATPTDLVFANGGYARNFERLKHIVGGSVNDSFTSAAGRFDNAFHGSGGDDTFAPGLGSDYVEGGAGTDTVVLDFSIGDTPDLTGLTNDGGQAIWRALVANGAVKPDYFFYRTIEALHVTGTSKADAVVGTPGSDRLIGGAGDDVLYATSVFVSGDTGADYIDGGDGNDTIRGSYSATSTGDTLLGGAGDDTFLPRTGSDTIFGGPNNDTLSGSDFPTGGYGNDVWDGGDGDDVLYNVFPGGNLASNTLQGSVKMQLDGGAGFDTLAADFGNQTQAINFIGGQTNSMEFADGSYFRNFERLTTVIFGSGNDNIVQPGRVNNSLGLGAGDDILDPGLGDDYIEGGGGNDLLILDYSIGDEANVSGVMHENGNSYVRRDLATNAIIDRIFSPGFERVWHFGGSKGDLFYGGNVADILKGNGGNDTIIAGNGDDLVEGGDGDDTLEGGFGNHTIDAGPGNDSVKLDINDTSSRLDKLDGGDGVDTLLAWNIDNVTTAVLFDSRAPTSIELSNGAYARNFEIIGNLRTGSGNDVITQLGRVNNDIRTGNGNDIIRPGLGIDFIDGGGGTDTFYLDYSVDDTGNLTGAVQEGGAWVRRAVSNNAIVDSITGPNIESVHVIATVKNDTFIGPGGDDFFDVRRGSDNVDGAAGIDTLKLDWSAMTTGTQGASFSALNASTGTGTLTTSNPANFQVVFANFERFDFTGTGLDDTLRGLALADTLRGSGGNDYIEGGEGADMLDGGDGNDTLYSEAPILGQWASSVIAFTSQFSSSHFAAANMLGVPDTFRVDNPNDSLKVWAAAAPNGTVEQLTLGYTSPVLATGVVVRETNGNGFVTRIDLLDTNDQFHTVFSGIDPSQHGTVVDFTVSFAQTDYLVKGVKIFVDTDHYNSSQREQIDAVQLIGFGARAGTIADQLIGGAGNDTFIVSSLGVSVVEVAGGGSDTIRSYLDTTLPAEVENLVLLGAALRGTGNALDNVIVGNAFANTLDGGPGADFIDGDGGDATLDKLDGGADVDTLLGLNLANFTTAVVWDSGAPVNFEFSGGGYVRNFENIGAFYTGAGNDLITQLGRLNNDIRTGAGDDIVNPGLGIDDVDGGDGTDTLILDYSVGDDDTTTGVVSEGASMIRRKQATALILDRINAANFEKMQVIATSKDDALTGTAGDDVFDMKRGSDSVDGGAGVDTLKLDWSNMATGAQGARYSALETASGSGTVATSDAARYKAVFTNFEIFYLKGTSLSDQLEGMGRADQLRGGAGDDELQGRGGDDLLDGGEGADRMRGDDGDDTYVVDNTGDVIEGETAETAATAGSGAIAALIAANFGNDTVRAMIDYALGAGLENLTLEGRALTGTGNALANILTGNARNNSLDGGDGNDVLTGGFGIGLAGSREIDRLHGGAGADLFVLGDADSRFYDDRSSLTPGTTGYAQVDDFTPAEGDRLRLKGTTAEYFLAPSGIAGAAGTGMFHDTNANGAFDPGYDELLAILDSPDPLTPSNTIDAAHFV